MTLPLSKIRHSSLLRPSAYLVDGIWKSATSSFPVIDPASTSDSTAVAALAANCSTSQVQEAIDSAAAAFPGWAIQTTARTRSEVLRKFQLKMLEHESDLAAIITAESGKPLAEARGEVKYGASYLGWFAEEAPRMDGWVMQSPIKGRRMMAIKQPLGVCGLITPWNFPVAMLARKAAASIAAGCTIVSKPAPETPLSALALGQIALEAGVPAGVFNVVPCSKEASVAAGHLLTTHPSVKKISFTGSTQVGKILMQQSSSTLKKLSLELGGNAPFIVFRDADLDLAIKALVAAKFRNCGQTCVSVNRVYVHSSVKEELTRKLHAKMSATLTVGRGDDLQRLPTIGPLISIAGVEKVSSLVTDAIGKGATLVLGGKTIPHLGPRFFQPTLLSDMKDDMRITTEEIFGPVLALYSFESEAEVVQRANSGGGGLAGYFFSKDLGRAFRVAEALEVGMVGINEGAISSEVAPFGGIKESGFGREGSRIGLDDFTYVKYVCIGGIKENLE